MKSVRASPPELAERINIGKSSAGGNPEDLRIRRAPSKASGCAIEIAVTGLHQAPLGIADRSALEVVAKTIKRGECTVGSNFEHRPKPVRPSAPGGCPVEVPIAAL